MIETHTRKRSGQKKAQRATQPRVAHEGSLARRGVPSYPSSLLGDSALSGRGNQPVQVAMMQQMQQTHGNRAVQRFFRRAGDTGAPAVSVQRCGGEVHEGCGCAEQGAGTKPLLQNPDAGLAALQRQPDGGTAAACALTTYSGSNFAGDTVTADVEFVDSLDAINTHAANNNVNLLITSSFRTSTVVSGAIVDPAKQSNHLAGHAIDMNVMYGPNKDKLCNSKCLKKGTLPAGVKEFIKAIQDDSGLRWGGDFNTPDVVHIDDGLNVNDATAWKERHKATQKARKDGCG